MSSLSKCFGVVKVIKPEEGYNPKTGEYGAAWEPEVTQDTSTEGKSTGCPDKGLTAMRKGVKMEKEPYRVERLAQYYSAIARNYDLNKEDEGEDYSIPSPFGQNGLRVDLPIFHGLRPSNPSVGGYVPQEKSATHLGVKTGRVGMRTK